MKYTPFGKTGLRVSQIALGTGNFGIGWGHGAVRQGIARELRKPYGILDREIAELQRV